MNESGEQAFLSWLAARADVGASGDVGDGNVGDDMAVCAWADGAVLASVDQCLDGVHFDSKIHVPEAIAGKAVKRSLSDCAAMGCRPVALLVSAALPIGSGLEYAKRLHVGAEAAAGRHGARIVGGDTAAWGHPLALSVTALGRAESKPVTRRGAKAGDGVFVSGPLGGSILGRHMTFEPRIELGVRLAGTGVVHSMMDISDGLSRDLPRLLVGLGAEIDAHAIPIHADAIALAAKTGRSAIHHALHDGEDYELLLTAAQAPLDVLIRIGTVTAGGGMVLRSGDTRDVLAPLGWDHEV
jgi:thiamine-monophosphate kinase